MANPCRSRRCRLKRPSRTTANPSPMLCSAPTPSSASPPRRSRPGSSWSRSRFPRCNPRPSRPCSLLRRQGSAARHQRSPTRASGAQGRRAGGRRGRPVARRRARQGDRGSPDEHRSRAGSAASTVAGARGRRSCSSADHDRHGASRRCGAPQWPRATGPPTPAAPPRRARRAPRRRAGRGAAAAWR